MGRVCDGGTSDFAGHSAQQSVAPSILPCLRQRGHKKERRLAHFRQSGKARLAWEILLSQLDCRTDRKRTSSTARRVAPRIARSAPNQTSRLARSTAQPEPSSLQAAMRPQGAASARGDRRRDRFAQSGTVRRDEARFRVRRSRNRPKSERCVRIPMHPAMHSNMKPAGDSDLIPATLLASTGPFR